MSCMPPDALILKTKFQVPSSRPNLVSRPRLLARLEQGLRVRATLISAQAGFGKTTLLGEWLAETQHRAAWVSLDETDNDPVRFSTSVITAFQAVDANLGRSGQSLLNGPACTSASLQDVLTSIINELLPFAPPILLVLDDYHLITRADIHGAVAFFLDHLPAHAHLMIASRTDPPLPLARLRVQNQLLEIRAPDLRFTRTEAAELLNRVMRLGLGERDVAALEERTEGWVAGLQLAALSLRDRADVAAVLASFHGSHPLVLDYLVEEILDRQPESVRQFLLQTSILDRMTAPLCNAVTDRQDAQAMLDILERGNLFLTPLDAGRCCYHYHPLFAEALVYRLQGIGPGEIATLHRRAAAWYERNGMLTEAAAHRQAASASTRAPAAVSAGEQPTPLLEPLNEREREILCLMSEGQSNREIADKLVLTVGTVKWYVTRLLAKLDAANRTEAVARARHLHLLS